MYARLVGGHLYSPIGISLRSINKQRSGAVWRSDIEKSVSMYDDWYFENAPGGFEAARATAVVKVADLLATTNNLSRIDTTTLRRNPSLLAVLRMTASPSLARDRLAGFADVPRGHLKTLEEGKIVTSKGKPTAAAASLPSIARTMSRLVDPALAPWLEEKRRPHDSELNYFRAVVTDRLAAADAEPILRNTQEERQLDKAVEYLEARGYRNEKPTTLKRMMPGTYALRFTVRADDTNIPVDLVLQPKSADEGDLPIMIEAKSAGDYANTNKRRKEESDKLKHLRVEFGRSVRYLLLIGGYFPETYLEYERDAGIDWIWEHNLDSDFTRAGF